MTALTQIIRAEIAEVGAISFARFMELALYCPEYGYYEKESDTVGKGGDFYTSVSVGSMFGELLAFQFAEWLEKIPSDRVQIVEAAAHDGKLALDILRWLKRWRPEVFRRIEYVVVDPSSRRRAWQEKTLGEFGGKVRWLNLSDLNGAQKVCGIIFANELLDAMPVHRLGWDSTRCEWFEWGVVAKSVGFDWAKLPMTVEAKQLSELPDELLEVLPDGYTAEICPRAEAWWLSAAQVLTDGKLVTLDYGSHNEAGLSPSHPNGTVRAFRRHKICEDVLADVGEQDITANVNFRSIQQVGEAAGLNTEAFASQVQFLAAIAGRMMASTPDSTAWTSQKSRELQTLIHPEHLGRAFRVLVQSR